MRVMSIIAGIGLAILWLVGLGSPNAAGWLTWLDAVAAVLCFVVAGVVRAPSNLSSGRTFAIGPMVVALGTFALWIIGMATNGAPWQNWWTFVFACVMAIGTFMGRRSYMQHPVTDIGAPPSSTTGYVGRDQRRSA